MRDEAALLDDIVAHGARIPAICPSLEDATLFADELRHAAQLHHFSVSGEAAGRLPADLRARRAEIPWPLGVNLRNKLVHVYFGAD
jgi:uncharacterized protein with HEPN domain